MQEPATAPDPGAASPLAQWAASLPPPPFVDPAGGSGGHRFAPSRLGWRSSSSPRSCSASCSGWRATASGLRRRPAVRLLARSAGPLARPPRRPALDRHPDRVRRRDRRHRRVPRTHVDAAGQRDPAVHRGLPEARGGPRRPAAASRRVLRPPADPGRHPGLDRQRHRQRRRGRWWTDRLDLPPSPRDRRRELPRRDLRLRDPADLGLLPAQGQGGPRRAVRPRASGIVAVRRLGDHPHG